MTDQERQLLWNYLFPNGKPFQSDWLNDLDTASSVANPSVPSDPLKRREKKIEEEKGVPLKDVAAIAGESEKDVAKKLDMWDYSKNNVHQRYVVNGVALVPAEKAISYLNTYAKDSAGAAAAIEQIQRQLKSIVSSKEREKEEKAVAAELKVYERYRITLPQSGKQISLADFFQQHKINPESCLLKNEIINGRVSYAAILDADITYGTNNKPIFSGNYTSPATGKPIPELESTRQFSSSELPEAIQRQLKDGRATVNQFVNGEKIVSYLALNGGGNIVVPEFYRDWIVFAHAYTRWDLYVSAGLAIASIGAVKNLQEVKETKEKAVERITRIREGSVLSKFEMDERLFGKVEKDAAGRLILEKPINTPGGGLAKTISIEDVNGMPTLVYRNSAGAQVDQLPGVDSIEKAIVARDLRFKRGHGGLEHQIEQAEINLRVFRGIKDSLTKRVVASYMFAGGWLGPARLFYSLNEGALFSARDSQDDKFLRLLVNKPVLEDFRRASGILAIGRVQELTAKYLGAGFTPEKAFLPERQMMINYPDANRKTDGKGMMTSLVSVGGDYRISTVWKGDSYALNYEDLRNIGGKDPYTAVDLVANKVIPQPVLEGKNIKALTAFFTLAIPFMAARKLLDLNEKALGAAVFLTTLEFIEVPDNYGKGVECDKKFMDDSKNKFRLAFAGSLITSALSIGLPFAFAKSTGFLWQYAASTSKVVDWVQPADLWRWWIGDAAITYTSNCKDAMHTLLSYQQVPQRVQAAAKNPLSEKIPLLDQLTVPRLLSTTEEERRYAEQLKKLTEILNLRSNILNQKSFLFTPELLYAHVIDSTFSTKTGLYDLIVKACELPERLQSTDGRSITLHDGLTLYDENGNIVAQFKSLEWKLRSLGRLRNQALARTIIPNKIISGTLSGSKSVFLEVSGSGQSTLINPPCSDFRQKIQELIGRDIGSDFTQAIGKITAIDTDAGQIGIQDGRVYFVNPLGTAVTAPTPEDLRKSITEGSRVTVLNNGEVVIHGPLGGEIKEQSAGTFKSILGENGRLEYNPSTRRIDLIIYSIFETSAQNFAGYTLAQRGNGVAIQARAKPGQEASADKLNKGLDKIAGKDGITMFETKDHIYYITPDGKLRVIDKKTGEAKEYNLTGKPRVEGNQLIVPTDKGDFKFSIENDNGRPTLHADGPDLKEILPLLVARGQNGILTFNPSTGAINVYNGQDIPMNPAFAEKGIGFSGNADGTTRGIPADNPFEKDKKDSGKLPSLPPLLLPSWPSEVVGMILLLVALLASIVVIRFSRE